MFYSDIKKTDSQTGSKKHKQSFKTILLDMLTVCVYIHIYIMIHIYTYMES